MKHITLDIYVSEVRAQEVLTELARFTEAISSACGSVNQKVTNE